MERSFRSLIVESREPSLAGWISPTQREELDTTGGQVNLCAHQSMDPQGRYQVCMSQDLDVTRCRASPQEDHLATQRSLEVELPSPGEVSSRRSRFESSGSLLPGRRDIGIRSSPDIAEAGVLEATPHLGLPTTVVVLYHRLKACLPRRREYRYDPQAQTQPGNPTETVRPLMGPLKDRVVVELSIARQAHLPPVLQKPIHSGFRGDDRFRPGPAQPSMKADAVEHLDIDSAPNHQPLDDVKAVQLSLARRQVRQVPALGRCGSSHAAAGIQGPSSLHDAPNGTNAGYAGPAFLLKGSLDGRGPILPQRAIFSQFSPQYQDPVFRGLSGTTRRRRTPSRSVGEVDTVHTLVSRSTHPTLNRAKAHAKLAGYLTQGLSLSDGCYHIAAMFLIGLLCLIRLLSGGFFHHCTDLRLLTLH